MNKRLIVFTLGWVLIFNAGFLLFPALVGLIYQEAAGWSFLITAGISLAIGFLFRHFKAKEQHMFSMDGMIIVALSWIVMSLIGALPFVIRTDSSVVQVNYLDALFETVSGFTTTGATIFSEADAGGIYYNIPHCWMFWRAFTHFVGGIGVLVFLMAILPLSGAGNMNMMKAESPGPEVGKILPKVKDSALTMCAIYLSLTVIEFICLLIAKMNVFDALTTAFSTAGTGGFSTKVNSLADESAAIQIIVGIFCILFAINFTYYFLWIVKKAKKAIKMIEVITFICIVIAATTIIAFSIRKEYSVGDGIRYSFFTVASLISTTGFVAMDYSTWPIIAHAVIFIIMCIGACAGSTGGGIKVSRIVILNKSLVKGLKAQTHPKRMMRIKMDDQEINHDTVRAVNTFMTAYLLIFAISFVLVSIQETDFTTNLVTVSATLNNVGPYFGSVSSGVNAFSSYADFSVLSKLVYIFDMLAGRLELFPILALFAPSSWRK